MHTEDIPILAADGRELAGTLYRPDAPKAALVVFSALGVKRSFYRRFAAWLADRDVLVVTFDYRGIGDSRTLPPGQDPATLLDWARLDVSAAVDFALDRFPGLPLWGLGHSFGGQAIGLSPRGRDLDGAFVVAAGSGDLELYPPHLRRRYTLLLGVVVPVIGRALGYVPARLGLGEDVPYGVIGQWARWCLTPGYVRGALGIEETHYHRIDAPMWFFDFPDDDFAPLDAAAELRSWYQRAPITHRTVAPRDIGLERLGHFDFFRAGATEALWEDVRAAMVGEVARRAAG